MILLWKLSDVPVPANNIFSEEDTDNKETWVVHKTLRCFLQITAHFLDPGLCVFSFALAEYSGRKTALRIFEQL